jgi:hypothetical protein
MSIKFCIPYEHFMGNALELFCGFDVRVLHRTAFIKIKGSTVIWHSINNL